MTLVHEELKAAVEMGTWGLMEWYRYRILPVLPLKNDTTRVCSPRQGRAFLKTPLHFGVRKQMSKDIVLLFSFLKISLNARMLKLKFGVPHRQCVEAWSWTLFFCFSGLLRGSFWVTSFLTEEFRRIRKSRWLRTKTTAVCAAWEKSSEMDVVLLMEKILHHLGCIKTLST